MYARFFVLILIFLVSHAAHSQTDTDGLMMAKRNLCGGFLYSHNSWDHYWEGTWRRKNENIGTFSSRSILVMANYGITSRVNVILMAPWISNKVSSGTLMGQSGFQDLSLFLKGNVLSKTWLGLDVSSILLLGGSMPLSAYVADYLPLSIGMQSKNLSGRWLMDVQKGNWFGTASAQYILRSNVRLDRNAYYTAEMIYSNQVNLPNQVAYQVRAGWRENADQIVELIFEQINTLGGFDMRRNEMPFLSNTMNASRLGLSCKLSIPKTNGLSFMGSAFYTLSGRNMGQARILTAGFVYQAEFPSKSDLK